MSTLTSTNESAVATPRSTFVTVLAWLSIVLASIATAISVLQATMFFAAQGVAGGLPVRIPPGAQELPDAARFLIVHPQVLFYATWTLAPLTLVAAIGLLHRRNWARVYFVALLGLGIAWQLFAVWMQSRLVMGIPPPPASMPPQFAAEMATMTTVLSVGVLVFAVLCCILFGWLITRLASRRVALEFRAR